MSLLVNTVVVFLVGLLATALNLVRAKRSRARRAHYVLMSLVAAYATVIYGLALAGSLDIRAIGPDYLRPWAILVLGSLAAQAVAHWKENGEA